MSAVGGETVVVSSDAVILTRELVDDCIQALSIAEFALPRANVLRERFADARKSIEHLRDEQQVQS